MSDLDRKIGISVSGAARDNAARPLALLYESIVRNNTRSTAFRAGSQIRFRHNPIASWWACIFQPTSARPDRNSAIGIFAAQAAVLQLDCFAFNVINETKASEPDAVLASTLWHANHFLNGLALASVVWIA